MPSLIPGSGSGFDSQGTIQRLVELEREPINRIEKEKKNINSKKTTWKNLQKKLQNFDAIIYNLYGFDRIFKKRKIYSENEDYIIATVLDNTKKGEYTIEIKNLAGAHKIITDKIPKDKKLPGATFIIQVGEDKIEITGFKNGGTINKLAEVLQNEADNLIKIRKLKVDEENVILSIESFKTGEKNRINIIKQSVEGEKLLKELGLIKSGKPISLKYNFNDKKPETLQFHDNGYNNSPALFIQSKQKYSLSIGKKIKQGIIEFVYRIIKPAKEKRLGNEVSQRNEVSQKSIGHVQIKDVTIFGADIIINPMKVPPSMKETVEKPDIFIEINDKANNKVRINLKAITDWETHKAELKGLEDIQSVHFVNNSTVHYLIDDLKIFSEDDKKTRFKNVVQKPEDAIFKIDGIELSRDNNENLKDIIDGITLNLLKKTPEPIKIKIREDKEKIETTLNDFIKQYNDILNFIIEAGKSSTKGKPGEPPDAKEIGTLSNDIQLMNLHSKLRSTVVSSYPTSFKEKLSTLFQIGISTGKTKTDWQNIKKGLLIFDKEKFNSVFQEFGDKTSEIFGYDSNNNKIIDTGVGYSLRKIIEPLTQANGVIFYKLATADAMIKSKNKAIKRKEKQLEDYEKKLRREYIKMERGLDYLKQSQNQLEYQMNSLPGTRSSSK